MQSTTEQPTSRPQALLAFIAFLILIALVGGVVWALWKFLNAASPEVAAAIIGAMATVLVSVASVIIAKQWERRSVIDQEHRKQKAPAYSEFLALLFRIFRSGQSSPLAPDELAKSMDTFTQGLIIWGSNDVIRKVAAFRQEAVRQSQLTSESVSGSDPEVVAQQALRSMLAFEAVLYAIRADLGHDVKGMKPGELMATFINDVIASPSNGVT